MKNSFYEELIELMMNSKENMQNFPQYIVPDSAICKKIDMNAQLELKDEYGRTILMYAVIYCGREVVAYLLERGANVNAKDNNGFTSLHFAVQSGKDEIVSLLLKAGGNANEKNSCGNSPLMLGNLATSVRIFEELILFGADPYQKNNYGVSPYDIHQNAFYSSEVIKKYLK